MSILASWAALAAGIFLTSMFLDRMKVEGGVVSFVVVSGLYGLLLGVTGWAIHLALGVMSFGLTWVFGFLGHVLVGAVVLKLTDLLSDRLEIKGFGTPVVASLILTATANAAYLLS